MLKNYLKFINLYNFGKVNKFFPLNIKTTMKKYINEFIGTFFVVLTMMMVLHNGSQSFAPIAIGAILVAVTYAGRHISGAHFNPAVTLAIFIRKKITLNDGVAYMLAQIIAAIFASYTSVMLLDNVANAAAFKAFQMTNQIGPLVAEFLGTFVLVYVFLSVASDTVNEGNSFFGLAIGLTMMAITFALGSVSGGSFNPAVAIGLSANRVLDWLNLWVYLAGSLGGAAVAAIIFGFLNNIEDI
jgi:aquaporin Z